MGRIEEQLSDNQHTMGKMMTMLEALMNAAHLEKGDPSNMTPLHGNPTPYRNELKQPVVEEVFDESGKGKDGRSGDLIILFKGSTYLR